MKTLNLNFEFDTSKLANEEEKKFFSENGHAGIFQIIFTQGINSIYSQGMTIKDGVVYNKISKKIEQLTKDEHDLELEDSEFAMIENVFLTDQAKFHPTQFGIIEAILSKVELCKLTK